MYQKLIEEAKGIVYNPPRTQDNRDRLSQIRFALSLEYGDRLLKGGDGESNYKLSIISEYEENRAKGLSQKDAEMRAKKIAKKAFGDYIKDQNICKYINTVIASIDVVITNMRDRHRNEDQALLNGVE